ncbi:uncharacterized protein K460DRAFT_390760 [Cucurbitaria berberidis CBS 394.84]|uniref:Uncharacterized protein n=1 Tax=Cucurbitaria berberidis CBS 394.84 TaxID=1168544 RepID=A0A9P4GRJ3_9PLEO|nr:uncharacterized protein K460DRAFT_390760 [Cucurbitaria berberidis CBS 394.84]KAF1850214.1 hypothetical protein K460DRAFT_390760 [Cucurbitaria berberidis CBS 394.84]
MMIHPQPFRLLDLPFEIRNKIYEEMLCSVGSTSTPDMSPLARIVRQEAEPNGINQVSHSIETTILRACRAVHLEAYDAMVKTNRFIRIRVTSPGMPGYLVRAQVPILTMDRAHTAQFRGYVMQLNMHLEDGLRDLESFPHLDFMILGRDWEAFCDYFTTVSRRERENSCIRLAFSPDTVDLLDYQAPLTDSFLEKTQTSLLKAFRMHARDLDDVQITGLVSPALATSVIAEVTSKSWQDTSKILADMQAAHKLAGQLFAANKIVKACSTWTGILWLIPRIERNPNWQSHTTQPDQRSAFDIVNELYFTAVANMGKCYLWYLRNPPTQLSTRFIKLLCLGALGHCTTALRLAGVHDNYNYYYEDEEDDDDDNDDDNYDEAVTATTTTGSWQPSHAAVVNLKIDSRECRRLLVEIDKRYVREG